MFNVLILLMFNVLIFIIKSKYKSCNLNNKKRENNQLIKTDNQEKKS